MRRAFCGSDAVVSFRVVRSASILSFTLASFTLASFTLVSCTIMSEKKPDVASAPAPSLPPTSAVFASNLLVFGDVNLTSSSVQGQLVAAGNAQLTEYSVGAVLPEDKSRCDLSVGGDLQFNSGSVYQGKICVVGTMSAPDVGTKFPGSGKVDVDFGALKQEATDLTAALANLPPEQSLDDKFVNGSRNPATLTGQNANANAINSWSLTGDLAGLLTSLTLDLPDGTNAIITIHGTNVAISDFSVTVKGSTVDRVLFVFPEATQLAIQRSNFLGTILAPLAALDFQQGMVTGSVVVASAEGDGRYILKVYGGALPLAPAVSPAPGSNSMAN